MEERFSVFIAEIDAQWGEILKLYAWIEKKVESLRTDMSNEDLVNSLAYKLHNLYCAYEDLFKLTANFFENQIEGFATYHTGLLKRMLVEIEGVRPNILSGESFKILDELRGFRHVFRHAYGYELDAERILKLAEKSIDLKKLFYKDFDAFKVKLREG